MEESLIEMYLAGVSVRRVDDITEVLWGTKVSPSTISELNKKVYRHIEAWRMSRCRMRCRFLEFYFPPGSRIIRISRLRYQS